MKEGSGRLEALILAADALGGAATRVAEEAAKQNGTLLVLAGDEVAEFGRLESLRSELDVVHNLFEEAAGRPVQAFDSTKDLGPAGLVAVGQAAAGLFGSETEVTSSDLTAALPSRVMALSVAAALGSRARLMNTVLKGPAPSGSEPTTWRAKNIAQAFNHLGRQAVEAQSARSLLGEKPAAKEKLVADRLDHALVRYKSMFDRVTAPDDKGVVPIQAAGPLETLYRSSDNVVRVVVEQAGGSLINTKNVATMFGVDPVKVTGGVVVSYVISEPRTGAIAGGGILACRSTLTSLRRVQTGIWRKRLGDASRASRCDKLI